MSMQGTASRRVVTAHVGSEFQYWGHLGGSVVERLPSAEAMMLGSQDGV